MTGKDYDSCCPQRCSQSKWQPVSFDADAPTEQLGQEMEQEAPEIDDANSEQCAELDEDAEHSEQQANSLIT